MTRDRFSDYHNNIRQSVEQHEKELLLKTRKCNQTLGPTVGPFVSTIFYGTTEKELKKTSMTKVPRKKHTDPVTDQDYKDYLKITSEVCALKRYQTLYKTGFYAEAEEFLIDQRNKRGIGVKRAEAIQAYRNNELAARHHVSVATKLGNALSTMFNSVNPFSKPPEERISKTEEIRARHMRRKEAFAGHQRMVKK